MKRFRILGLILPLLFVQVPVLASSYMDSLFNEKGKFDHWRVMRLKESGIIGGNVKTIYKLSEGDTITGQEPFVQRKEDVFAPCNIMGRVLCQVVSDNGEGQGAGSH